jgi:hypothetical protein
MVASENQLDRGIRRISRIEKLEKLDELAAAVLAQRPVSFGHLVGAGEERGRNVEAKRLGCLEVDRQLEASAEMTPYVAKRGGQGSGPQHTDFGSLGLLRTRQCELVTALTVAAASVIAARLLVKASIAP